MTNLQEYLNIKYPTPQEKEQVKEISITLFGVSVNYCQILNEKETKKLTGDELDLREYHNLEHLVICGDKLQSKFTNLDVSNCLSLTELYYPDNQLTNLDVTKCVNLTKLGFSNNQLTNLDVSNLLKLNELLCNNNNLEDILLPTDAEKLVLERLDISNNKNLNYSLIESRFLKPLPTLIKSEIKAIDKEELEKIIRDRASIHGVVETIDTFSTWWNPNCALITNKIVWRVIHLVIYEPVIEGQVKKYYQGEITETKILSSEVFKVFKVMGELETLTKIQAQKKVEELKAQLNGDNPILTLYPNNSGFSPHDIMQITEIPWETFRYNYHNPHFFFKSTDLVWRSMDNMPSFMPDCYHVAVYLGNSRVAHIGSSKFAKVSKIKENKSLLGARNDHWLDFLHFFDKGKNENETNKIQIIRYHPIIPFQRPEKIQEHITKAVLAEYGAKEYSFLGNNCEHFATLAVCGVPFSTQADKIKMITNYVYLNLAQEIQKSAQAFAKMSNTETFIRESRRAELYQTITNLKSKTELTKTEEEQLDDLVIKSRKLQDSLESIFKLQFEWEKRIENSFSISGVIIKIIPLKTNENQALVINKVAFYAIHWLEYDPRTKKITELKRFAKNKVGYATLADVLDKVNRFTKSKESNSESLQTSYQIEIPTNK